MSNGLELDVLRAGAQAIVRAEGPIDISTAPALRERVVDLVSTGVTRIVLNLEATSYVDAAGVDTIVRAFKLLSAHDGTLSVVCPQEHLVKLFDVSDLSDAFHIYATLEEAVAGD